MSISLINRTRVALAFVATLASGSALVAGAAPAAADDFHGGFHDGGFNARFNVGDYTGWRPDFDNGRFDRRHVMLGTVRRFEPYRLTIRRDNGVTQTVDLKNGTVILPEGATPERHERVALVGYYSNGTFIANRVILRG